MFEWIVWIYPVCLSFFLFCVYDRLVSFLNINIIILSLPISFVWLSFQSVWWQQVVSCSKWRGAATIEHYPTNVCVCVYATRVAQETKDFNMDESGLIDNTTLEQTDANGQQVEYEEVVEATVSFESTTIHTHTQGYTQTRTCIQDTTQSTENVDSYKVWIININIFPLYFSNFVNQQSNFETLIDYGRIYSSKSYSAVAVKMLSTTATTTATMTMTTFGGAQYRVQTFFNGHFLYPLLLFFISQPSTIQKCDL